jgi:hypothetical protein
MAKTLWTVLLAFAVSAATVWINPATDEKALYGTEGSVEQNWRPRAVAGWPAPFLADDPGTSVPHQIGVEDTFRLGPFVATLSFWILVVTVIWRLAASLILFRRG